MAMPISPMDEYLAHQTTDTFDYVFTSDRNFYDRYYFNMHASSDELFMVAGMGQYPNLGVTDAFVTISHGTEQYVVRASRALGNDRLDTQVGPFSIEVIEGLKTLRLKCDENEWGLSFDIVFEPVGAQTRRCIDDDIDGEPTAAVLDGLHEATVGEDGGVDSLRQIPQVPENCPGVTLQFNQGCFVQVAALVLGACQPELGYEGNQFLLGAIMNVAFQTSTFRFLGMNDSASQTGVRDNQACLTRQCLHQTGVHILELSAHLGAAPNCPVFLVTVSYRRGVDRLPRLRS